MNFELKGLKVPIILFLLSLFINVYGIWWGLPNYYPWGVDDLTPNAPLLIAKNRFQIDSRYPIFHYVLLDVVYAPYLAYLYLTGGLVNPGSGFPYGFTDPLTSLTVLMVLSRLVSAIMGSLAVVFVYSGVKALYGKKVALFSALSVSFSYVFIQFSHLGNLDIPYTFWFSIAIYSYVKLIKTYKTRYYILLGVFTALAVSTKDQIVGFFVLLPIPLLYLHIKHTIKRSGLKSAILNKKLLYCLIALMLTFLIFNNVLIDFSGFKYRMNLWGSGEVTDKYAQFPSTFSGQLELFKDFLLKLEYSVGPVLFALFLLSFFYGLIKFDRYKFALLIPLISYYIFDIARIHYLYDRMMIPVIIVLSFFLGSFLSDFFKKENLKKIMYTILIVVFAYTFMYGFSADLELAYDSRHSAEDWMIKNIEKNARIEVYHDMRYLPRFHALGYNNVSMVFLDYKGDEKPPLLLFEPVIDSSTPEALKKRDPEYIVLPGCCYNIDDFSIQRKEYIRLLLSENLGYGIVKVFDNKIPFAPETPFLNKRTNLPVIILKKE